MNDILKEIISQKNQRLIQRKQELPEANLRAKIETTNPPPPFIKSINRSRLISLIAEIKKASPSCGIIREDFNPSQIARIYKEAGAQAVSILTCEDYFFGDINYLIQVKEVVDLPILRKDFIIQPYQIYESRAFGCSALLLIAELLSQETLSEFLDLAKSLNLDCLVEVHNIDELYKVLETKPNIIGINNRNLENFSIDLSRTGELSHLIPKDCLLISESGIKNHQDIEELSFYGIDAVLIGETLMSANNPSKRLKELVGVVKKNGKRK